MQVRSLFISDVHLGNRACQAGELVRFLAGIRAERIYLVGDILDFEAMEAGFYWHGSHTAVLRALLGAARRGARVTYIPGNHDERLRAWCGRRLGPVAVERFVIHTAADGCRYLVLHGDEFDGILGRGGWLRHLGAMAYRSIIRLNTRVNHLRRQRGYAYLPLASALKHRVGSARLYMERFRATVVDTARGLDMEGVVCGHIHRPEHTLVDGLRYLNTGDWVENCSALVEHRDGAMELLLPAAQSAQAAVLSLTEAELAKT